MRLIEAPPTNPDIIVRRSPPYGGAEHMLGSRTTRKQWLQEQPKMEARMCLYTLYWL